MSIVDLARNNWRALLIASGVGLAGGAALDGARGAFGGLVLAPGAYMLGLWQEKGLKRNGIIRAHARYVTLGEAQTADANLAALINSTKYMIDVGPNQDDSKINVGPVQGTNLSQVEILIIGNYAGMKRNNSRQTVIDQLVGARLNRHHPTYRRTTPVATLSKRT